MRAFIPRSRKGPEAGIQQRVVEMLLIKGWFVLETHGNMYQSGFPDLFATHSSYRQRWIEIKNPTKYEFTPAQLETFPKLVAHGAGVWILVDDTEHEYMKLFTRCNWFTYLREWRRFNG